MSAIRSKLSKVEFDEEDEDEFQFVFPTSPQLLKEGLCCSERRPLFRRVAREKATSTSALIKFSASHEILFRFREDLNGYLIPSTAE